MKTTPKTNTIFLITAVLVLTFSPIIVSTLYFYTGIDDRNSTDRDNADKDNYNNLATSSIPAYQVWSYASPSNIRNVAISSDGQYIAVGCYDWNLYLFEKDNSTPLWSSNVGQTIEAVAISSDGQYIVAGTGIMGEKVYLFEKDDPTPLWSYATGGRVNSLAISSDGQYIAVGTGRFDYSVLLFRNNNSTPLWRYNTGGHVASVAISSDGNYIVAGNHDDKLYFFEKNSSTPIWTYTTPDWAQTVSISSDGNYILVGTADGTNPLHGIYLFEKNNSTPLWKYTTGDPIWSCAISPDGQYIVFGTAYTGNQVYFFERNSSTPLWSFNASDSVSSVALSSDGQYIIAGSYDDKVYLFSKNSSTPIFDSITGGSVASVAISSNGYDFVSGGNDNNAYLFRIAVIPHITINLPILNQLYGLSAPEFSVTINNLSPLNKMWYTINDGLTNYTFTSLTGFINQTAWDMMDESVLTIRFYAKDSLGHVGFKDIQILKDSINPLISIHFPHDNNVFGSKSPEFNISVIEENLISTWYTIDGGLTNLTFTSLTGFINQTAWDMRDEGVLTIRFYAKDSLGHVGFKDIQIIKDTINPNITIHSPLEEESFGNSAPSFHISILEENLVSVWYTLEGVAVNYSFSELTGKIDQGAWTDAPEGQVNITFYAQDSAGNIGIKSVVVIKSVTPQIPGYDLFFLIGILSFVSIILIMLQDRKIYLNNSFQ
jgi:WD40 repeat protein